MPAGPLSISGYLLPALCLLVMNQIRAWQPDGEFSKKSERILPHFSQNVLK